MKIKEITEGFWSTVGHGLATGAGLTNVAAGMQSKMNKNIKLAPIALSTKPQVSTHSDVDAAHAEKGRITNQTKYDRLALDASEHRYYYEPNPQITQKWWVVPISHWGPEFETYRRPASPEESTKLGAMLDDTPEKFVKMRLPIVKKKKEVT